MAIACSPDGQTLVAAGPDGSIWWWNLPPQTNSNLLLNSGRAVCFSTDGRFLVTVKPGEGFILWDVATCHRAGFIALPPSAGNIKCQTITRDLKTLAIGNTNGSVEIWNSRTMERERVLYGDDTSVTQLALPQAGNLVVAVSQRGTVYHREGTVRIWGKLDAEPEVFEHCFGPLVTSPDERWLAFRSADATMNVYDVWNKKLVGNLDTKTPGWAAMGLSAEKQLLAVGPSGHLVQIWDVGQRKLLASWHSRHSSRSSLTFSPDGRTLELSLP